MGESFKAVSALLLIVASFVTIFGWMSDGTGWVTWLLRIGSPAVAITALCAILALQFRRDMAPDFLAASCGNYFNRNGFCFAFSIHTINGTSKLLVWFQNQYEGECVGRIALRPAQGFFHTRPSIEPVAVQISCEGGAFGTASLPLAVPAKYHGKQLSFEVGAASEYSRGHGRRLRFRDGIFLRANADFGDTFRTTITAIGALAGGVVLTRPATVTLRIPPEIDLEPQPPQSCRTVTHWKLGDPIPAKFTVDLSS